MLFLIQWCVQMPFTATWKAGAGRLLDAENTETNNRTKTQSQIKKKTLSINYVKCESPQM